MSARALYRRLQLSLVHPLRAYVPSWLRRLVFVAAALTLILNVMAGCWSSGFGYQGLSDAEDTEAMCKASLPVFKPSLPASKAGASKGICDVQLPIRGAQIARTQAALTVACKRRAFFEAALSTNLADARRSLKEETVEIQDSFSKLRELTGPAIGDALGVEIALMAFSMAMMIGANYLAGMHAASAGIRPLREAAEFRTPFLWGVVINSGVALAVLYRESVDPRKSSYGWDSYCVCEPASWLAHGSILGVSLVCATSLGLGWYFSRADHVPKANPAVPRWGVGGYVTFLETWSFAIVTLVGVLEAVWIHSLAAAPSRTNVTMAFLGAGALVGAGVLVGRFVHCALLLRSALEEQMRAAPERDKWPTDPTDGILGQHWWQLPALFVVAGGLAYQLLDSAGVARLLHGAP